MTIFYQQQKNEIMSMFRVWGNPNFFIFSGISTRKFMIHVIRAGINKLKNFLLDKHNKTIKIIALHPSTIKILKLEYAFSKNGKNNIQRFLHIYTFRY